MSFNLSDTTIPQLPQGFGQNSKKPFFNVSGADVLSGLFGLGSSLVQSNQAKKAHKRSIALMNRQFDMSKEMWKTQNAYNTPMKQMERLKQAGLNPALMYGQGNTGNANNAPQPSFNELAPFTTAGDIAQSTASGIQMSLAGAQKQLLQANATKSSIDGAVKAGEYGIAKEMSKYQMQNLEQDTFLKEQQTHNTFSDTILKDYEMTRKKLENRKMSYEVKALERNKEAYFASHYAKLTQDVIEVKAKELNLKLTEERTRQVQHKIWQDWVNAGSGVLASASFITKAIKSLFAKGGKASVKAVANKK